MCLLYLTSLPLVGYLNQRSSEHRASEYDIIWYIYNSTESTADTILMRKLCNLNLPNPGKIKIIILGNQLNAKVKKEKYRWNHVLINYWITNVYKIKCNVNARGVLKWIKYFLFHHLNTTSINFHKIFSSVSRKWKENTQVPIMIMNYHWYKYKKPI